jgi:hypothetical protein
MNLSLNKLPLQLCITSTLDIKHTGIKPTLYRPPTHRSSTSSRCWRTASASARPDKGRTAIPDRQSTAIRSDSPCKAERTKAYSCNAITALVQAHPRPELSLRTAGTAERSGARCAGGWSGWPASRTSGTGPASPPQTAEPLRGVSAVERVTTVEREIVERVTIVSHRLAVVNSYI